MIDSLSRLTVNTHLPVQNFRVKVSDALQISQVLRLKKKCLFDH